jgi:DNA-directed RNA polymerase specialized sigma24 family protein
VDEPLAGERPEVQRLLKALERCRDLLQDLILKAVEKLPAIETPELWLEATARDLGILPGRKPQRRLPGPAATQPPAFAEPAPMDVILPLAAVLALLPLTERQFVVLRALDFSALEIAKRSGYHPASVRKVVKRAIARVTATLDASPRVGPQPRHPHPSPATRIPVPAAPLTTSPRTRASNFSHLRQFARWLGAEDPQAALAQLLRGGPQEAAETLARFHTAMLESGLSDRTVKNRLSVLRVIVRLAAQHGLIQWQLQDDPR